MNPAITVQELRKTYRFPKGRRGFLASLAGLVSPDYVELEAVGGVSFEIAAGERVAIIGPNGAGKSTTLKMLCGVLEPTAGAASVLGFTPWRQRQALAYEIGVVFGQRSQLWTELPVRDSFALLRQVYDQPQAAFAERLSSLVDRFGVGELMDQPVNRLSLGQRMRCEIVASLLHGPSLLFLDEPTIGLDVTAKAAIRDFIREQSLNEGQTVVLTSHDTRDIELVCERVIVIDAGRIVIDEPTGELRRRFIARKLVTLRSQAPTLDLDLPGVTRRPAEPHTTVLEIDTKATRVDGVIAAALALGGIEDVTIEDPPMEEVIHEIFAAIRR
ncbi:MAG TPA: ATP-binding cassette domain-containing protein [Caulobacteraceae bacterium]|jgi:ABC-2 type transport system ATP-binding protein